VKLTARQKHVHKLQEEFRHLRKEMLKLAERQTDATLRGECLQMAEQCQGTFLNPLSVMVMK
jgi:hypothetical protein